LVEDAAEGLPGPLQVWQIGGGGLDRLREDGLDVDDAQLRERRQAVSAGDLATRSTVWNGSSAGTPRPCCSSRWRTCSRG
jgi:long-chain acyl-CoA synthetase